MRDRPRMITARWRTARSTVSAVIVAAAAACCAGAAETIEFGGSSLRVPDGWIVDREEDQIIAKPSVPAGQGCFLMLSSDSEPEMPLGAWAAEAWGELTGASAEVAAQDLRPMTGNAAGVLVASGSIAVDSTSTISATMWAMRFGSGAGVAVFGAADVDTCQPFRAEAERMLAPLFRRSAGADTIAVLPVSAPSAGRAGATLDGLWCGMVGRLRPNLQYDSRVKTSGEGDLFHQKDQFKSSVEEECWTFFADGLVIAHAPWEGRAVFDKDDHRRIHGGETLVHRVEGRRVIVQEVSGRPRFEFSMNGNALSREGSRETTYRVPDCDGLTFSGTYADAVGRSATMQGLTAQSGMAQTAVNFFRDGRFVDPGGELRYAFLYKTAYMNTPERSTWEAGGQGRYRIQKNTILFEYSDGRKVTANFYVAGEPSASPEIVHLGSRTYVRLETEGVRESTPGQESTQRTVSSFGGVALRLPPGWSSEAADGAFVWSPPNDLGEPQCVVMVLPGAEAGDDLEQWAAGLWARFSRSTIEEAARRIGPPPGAPSRRVLTVSGMAEVVEGVVGPTTLWATRSVDAGQADVVLFISANANVCRSERDAIERLLRPAFGAQLDDPYVPESANP